MTVHASKGLEFDAVFICGVEEGLFPHENAIAEEDGVEEERRLMYVAITRARKKLWLSFAAQRMMHGKTRYSLKSRFFEELPDEHLHWLTPKTNGYGTQYSKMLASSWDDSAHGAEEKSYQTAWADRADTGRGARDAAAKIVAKQAADPSHPWRTGQAVRHAKFGEGLWDSKVAATMHVRKSILAL
jgi:DNA helicase II / ATP-dependent DNA helicase PcrA